MLKKNKKNYKNHINYPMSANCENRRMTLRGYVKMVEVIL